MQTATRKKEYEEYFERRERLKNQRLTRDIYDKNMTQMSERKASLEALAKAVQGLRTDLQKNEEQISHLTAMIAKEQHLLEKMQKRGKVFALFCREYQSYIECMEQMNRSQKEQERHE